MKAAIERFSSTSEFVKAMDERPINNAWKGYGRSSRNEGDARWRGTESWDDAVDIAYKGYGDVVDKVKVAVKRSTSSVFKRVEKMPVRPTNSFVGGSPNVARAMIGVPRDMRSMQRIDRKKPGVTIVYECSACARVSTEDMINAGSRMVALVKLLERDQVPTRIILSDVCETSGETAGMEVVLKDFHNGLNLQKIAFFMAHPAMHRRLFFSWMETSHLINRHDFGYGCPISNNRSTYEPYRESVFYQRGEYWFCYKDFLKDEDVLKAYEKVTK